MTEPYFVELLQDIVDEQRKFIRMLWAFVASTELTDEQKLFTLRIKLRSWCESPKTDAAPTGEE